MTFKTTIHGLEFDVPQRKCLFFFFFSFLFFPQCLSCVTRSSILINILIHTSCVRGTLLEVKLNSMHHAALDSWLHDHTFYALLILFKIIFYMSWWWILYISSIFLCSYSSNSCIHSSLVTLSWSRLQLIKGQSWEYWMWGRKTQFHQCHLVHTNYILRMLTSASLKKNSLIWTLLYFLIMMLLFGDLISSTC